MIKKKLLNIPGRQGALVSSCRPKTGRLGQLFKCECKWLFESVLALAIDWRLVPDVPCLFPKVNWVWLQLPCDLK